MERTFIAIKPDGVQRGLIGDIIKRFEVKGFKLVAMKFMQYTQSEVSTQLYRVLYMASEDHLKLHYADLSDKPFFAGLVKYMASAPLLAMVWEGNNVVRTARNMMGETKPFDSKPGTIRGDFCIDVGRQLGKESSERNIIHGSDSVESANKEIALWFKSEELVSWTQGSHAWIYE
ncbi:hypothetical protein HAZT_HAZT001993 [Hyalella azteca]|uniref:Nucleoside diphosphate kinase n=1 Tax=Hyalella azteca TaxID=294128 RepID=A0A6A0GNX4_HYAAZ|nr:hypothetical protein HAZT_HAZT001993 [Hyalella azteca]